MTEPGSQPDAKLITAILGGTIALGIGCLLVAVTGGPVKVLGMELPDVHQTPGVRTALGVTGSVLVIAVLIVAGLIVTWWLRQRPVSGSGTPTEEKEFSPPTIVAKDAEVGPKQWHSGLSTGHLELELDPRAGGEAQTLISVVGSVLREKNFHKRTEDRVAIVLIELLNNVVQHTDAGSAWVSIRLQEEFVRYVSIAVYDSGPGLGAEDIIGNHMKRLVAGEREHGLLRVYRMVSSIRTGVFSEAPADKQHGVWCDVYDPQPPHSVLFGYDAVAPVRMEYEVPRVFWLGEDDAYIDGPFPVRDAVGTFIATLTEAVQKGWRPVLDLYFAPLLSAEARYLAVEVTGGKVSTEQTPGHLSRLRDALESTFQSHFADQRVILLSHDTEMSIHREVSEWAERWGLEHFRSEATCRKRLVQLVKGD